MDHYESLTKNDRMRRSKREEISDSDDSPEVQEFHPLVPKYACQRHSPRPCVNQALVDQLKILRWNRFLEFGSQTHEFTSYAMATSSIIACPFLLKSAEEVRQLPGVGPKIVLHVKDFFEDNRGYIPEARDIENNPRYQTLSEFVQVQGIGDSTARDLYNSGVHSMEQLRALGKYTDNMRYFDDLKQKLSRKDVETIQKFVQLQLDRIKPGAHIEPCGGYRRGKEFSGDCDLLITYPHREGEERGVLARLMERLLSKGFIPPREEGGVLAESYSGTHRTTPQNRSASVIDALDRAFVIFLQPLDNKFVEGFPQNGRYIARRVDLIVSRWESWGSAVVGWTGSTQFERDLRKHANSLKYKFDSGGIQRLSDSQPVPAITEQDVFRILKLDWIPPHLRNADP